MTDTRAAALRKLQDGTPAVIQALRDLAQRGCDPRARQDARGILDLLNQPEPGEQGHDGATGPGTAQSLSEAHRGRAAHGARGRARLMLRSVPNDADR